MIKLDTERLKIYTASRDEMQEIIDSQTDGVLKTAYRQMLQGASEHPDQWEWYAIWIIENKEGSKVGDLCFKGLNEDGSAEIGYGISTEFRGRGYAAEAVGAAVSWALDQPGVRRVEAETGPDNTASQRVLEKCGFVPAGTTGEEGPRFIKAL
ncbi:MAG: GNAT family N-acetyltransferase [Clostridia bacterium]|nr:GNAT family N-acetyltransferase [Clostridia bacterium]